MVSNVGPANNQQVRKMGLQAVFDNMTKNAQSSVEGTFGDMFGNSMNNISADVSKAEVRQNPDLADRGIDKADEFCEVANDTAQKSATESIIRQAVQPEKTAEDIPEYVLDSITQEIRDILKDTLKLTDEELDSLLAESGMMVTDLLLNQNLATFVAQTIADGDMMAVLTNDDVSTVFREISAKLDAVITTGSAELEITKSELTEILKDYEQTVITTDTPQNTEENYAEQYDAAETGSHTDVVRNVLTEDTDSKEVQQQNGQQVKDNAEAQPLESKVTFESDKESTPDKQGTHEDSNSNNNLSGQFVENLVERVSQQAGTKNVFDGNAVTAEDVVRQIVDAIKVRVNENASSMEIQLTPENLGRINMLVSSREGVITAQLTAQNETVKTIIENQLVLLKESFNAQGLKVEAVEVTIESHGFETGRNFEGSTQDQDTDRNNRSTRQLTLDEINERLEGHEEISEEELLAAEMMRANGGNVDYLA